MQTSTPKTLLDVARDLTAIAESLKDLHISEMVSQQMEALQKRKEEKRPEILTHKDEYLKETHPIDEDPYQNAGGLQINNLNYISPFNVPVIVDLESIAESVMTTDELIKKFVETIKSYEIEGNDHAGDSDTIIYAATYSHKDFIEALKQFPDLDFTTYESDFVALNGLTLFELEGDPFTQKEDIEKEDVE